MTTASIPAQRRRWALAVGAAAASGILLWLASPAVGLGWVAWVALVPAGAVAFRLAGTRPGRLALPLALGVSLELLLVPGLPFGIAENQWAGQAVRPLLVGDSPVLVVALLVVPLAVAALYALRFPFFGPESVLAGALAWTALDFVRVRLDPGGFWGTLFVTQHDTAAGAIAALGGPWLVSFAIAGVGLGLARGRLPGAVAAAAAAALGIGGALADRAPGPGETVVAAVQPGYDTASYELPLLQNHRRGRYEAAAHDLVGDLRGPTREAAARGAAVVVWPEAVAWVDPRATPTVLKALAELAKDAAVTLVVPYFLPGPAQSAAVAFGPDGSPSAPAPKQRPMWYVGESGGNRQGPPRPLGELGTTLGVDNRDPAVARRLATAGASLLVSSTHDWAELATQQLALARVWSRALAVPLVRADWRYGSAILDRRGVLAHAPAGRAVLTAAVSAPGWTPYRAVGDALGWLAVAGTLAPAALRRRASAG